MAAYSLDDLFAGRVPSDGNLHDIEGLREPVRVEGDTVLATELVSIEDLVRLSSDAIFDMVHESLLGVGEPFDPTFIYDNAVVQGGELYLTYVTGIAGLSEG